MSITVWNDASHSSQPRAVGLSVDLCNPKKEAQLCAAPCLDLWQIIIDISGLGTYSIDVSGNGDVIQCARDAPEHCRTRRNNTAQKFFSGFCDAVTWGAALSAFNCTVIALCVWVNCDVPGTTVMSGNTAWHDKGGHMASKKSKCQPVEDTFLQVYGVKVTRPPRRFADLEMTPEERHEANVRFYERVRAGRS